MKINLFALLLLCVSLTQAQQNSFNKKLASFCEDALKQTANIPDERKVLLDKIAVDMAKKRYLMFTCKTNSRRTLLLQAWTQAAFIYVGLYNKFTLSTGDTTTQVYSEIAHVLTASGFYCSKTENGSDNGYLISVNEELPINIILSKNYFGNIDTSNIVITSICDNNEVSNIAQSTKHFNLPYQNPVQFDGTEMEKSKYAELNRNIAVEMMYLASKIKENIALSFDKKK